MNWNSFKVSDGSISMIPTLLLSTLALASVVLALFILVHDLHSDPG